jgi:hypothetical protein
VAVGDNKKGAHSADGVTWTGFDLLLAGETASNFTAAAWGGNKFVIVDNHTQSYYSFNGVSWNYLDIEYGNNNPLYAVAWGGGKFVAAGSGGRAYYASLAGITARLVFGADGVVRWAKE